MKGGRLKHTCENITGTANFHFFVPVAANFAVAYGAIYKPAKVSAFKFIGRALLFLFGGAVFYFPAGFIAVYAFLFAGDQKVHLSFHSRRNGAPALLIAVDGFQGCAQQLGHLFLGFI
jgi:hypothetical protein